MSETSSSRIPCEPVPAGDRALARRLLRERRGAVAPGARGAADRSLFAAAGELIGRLIGHRVPDAPVVAGYWPMAGEPDPRPALADWHRAGWRLALPVVRQKDAPLEFCAWQPGDDMAPGPMGTWHPARCIPTTPDVLVIPCLGFDAGRYRLGYGGGYYDRTIEALVRAGRRVVTIGVAHDDAQMIGFEPHAHDRALDCIVTESRRLPDLPAPR
ncbi:MAG TPA: 5-formyltetrahydrofolate cyclo-ligase [Burkholderiaceae bacterium]|nr:5-formyltetrahydrofolate cyclo-ligase [Burkholderiaceae bacterium]